MSTVLLIVQLIISIILTGLILIQRSEGGALGIGGGGGGGGGGGFMSGRSATNSIQRMTAILGTLFILNCLALSIVFNKENQNISLIDDTQAIESLTGRTDSSDETIPLADETVTPQDETGTSPETPEETVDTDEPETPEP